MYSLPRPQVAKLREQASPLRKMFVTCQQVVRILQCFMVGPPA